jgi:molybdopterin/thiamine biosynthesis adenylyltransferase
MGRKALAAKQATDKLAGRQIKVIGIGGVGSAVAQALAQFLAFREAACPLWLIDGDFYEERNRERVFFQSYGNKAEAKAREFAAALNGRVSILPVARYVTSRNARRLIEERDIIFLCVDNHATRKTVSQRAQRLKDVILISGGNDGIEKGQAGTFGNVQIYRRENARELTSPLTRFHPEIAHPQDRSPDQLGCAALVAQAAPQLLFTNLAVASAMLGTFYAWLTDRLDYEELYLDLACGQMTPVRRAPP